MQVLEAAVAVLAGLAATALAAGDAPRPAAKRRASSYLSPLSCSQRLYFSSARGRHDIAVETFDQATGAIVKVLRQESDGKNGYATLGVFGHAGLSEFEHVARLFVDRRGDALADLSVEFYDLVKGAFRIVVLPNAFTQAQSGGAVAVDPIHRLFPVGQEFSGTAPHGSSIQVFDEQGEFVESLDGFRLPASPAPMMLDPARRAGYVIATPELTSLQSFTY